MLICYCVGMYRRNELCEIIKEKTNITSSAKSWIVFWLFMGAIGYILGFMKTTKTQHSPDAPNKEIVYSKYMYICLFVISIISIIICIIKIGKSILYKDWLTSKYIPYVIREWIINVINKLSSREAEQCLPKMHSIVNGYGDALKYKIENPHINTTLPSLYAYCIILLIIFILYFCIPFAVYCGITTNIVLDDDEKLEHISQNMIPLAIKVALLSKLNNAEKIYKVLYLMLVMCTFALMILFLMQYCYSRLHIKRCNDLKEKNKIISSNEEIMSNAKKDLITVIQKNLLDKGGNFINANNMKVMDIQMKPNSYKDHIKRMHVVSFLMFFCINYYVSKDVRSIMASIDKMNNTGQIKASQQFIMIKSVVDIVSNTISLIMFTVIGFIMSSIVDVFIGDSKNVALKNNDSILKNMEQHIRSIEGTCAEQPLNTSIPTASSKEVVLSSCFSCLVPQLGAKDKILYDTDNKLLKIPSRGFLMLKGESGSGKSSMIDYLHGDNNLCRGVLVEHKAPSTNYKLKLPYGKPLGDLIGGFFHPTDYVKDNMVSYSSIPNHIKKEQMIIISQDVVLEEGCLSNIITGTNKYNPDHLHRVIQVCNIMDIPQASIINKCMLELDEIMRIRIAKVIYHALMNPDKIKYIMIDEALAGISTESYERILNTLLTMHNIFPNVLIIFIDHTKQISQFIEDNKIPLSIMNIQDNKISLREINAI